MKHIVGIIKAIKNGVSDFASAKYDEAGDVIAEITVDIFGKVKDTYTNEPIDWDLIDLF